jgi:hypothetical protein
MAVPGCSIGPLKADSGAMGLFGFFRRKPAVRDVADLTVFIDEQAAYLVQRYIFDYTHARSGPFSQRLLAQPVFMEAVNRSRWQAYPFGLAMIGEMVEGVLRPHAGEDRRAVLDPLRALILGILDRYGIPAQVSAEEWRAGRDELARKLDQIGTHPPKMVQDIPEPYAERYFNLMPFSKDLLTNDVPTTRRYLQLTLINIRDELLKRIDAADMAARLRSS